PPHHLTSDAVLDLLRSLVEKSLVLYEEAPPAGWSGGGERYRLLETVRQYARDRLMEGGDGAAVRGRHLDCVLALCEQVETLLLGPEQAAWLDRLEAEHDNLRAALEWAGAVSPAKQLRLAGAAGWFWEMRSYFAEGRQWLEQ